MSSFSCCFVRFLYYKKRKASRIEWSLKKNRKFKQKRSTSLSASLSLQLVNVISLSSHAYFLREKIHTHSHLLSHSQRFLTYSSEFQFKKKTKNFLFEFIKKEIAHLFFFSIFPLFSSQISNRIFVSRQSVGCCFSPTLKRPTLKKFVCKKKRKGEENDMQKDWIIYVKK